MSQKLQSQVGGWPGGCLGGSAGNKANLSLNWSWSWVEFIQQQCQVLNKLANKKKDAVDDVDTINECIVDGGDDAEHDLKHERSLSFSRGRSILILMTK